MYLLYSKKIKKGRIKVGNTKWGNNKLFFDFKILKQSLDWTGNKMGKKCPKSLRCIVVFDKSLNCIVELK